MKPTRKLDIHEFGLHRITLEASEDGSLGLIEQNGFAVPYFYSVPDYWVKSPSALLMPRAVARADGLTVVE